jgi:hypothetical protein
LMRSNETVLSEIVSRVSRAYVCKTFWSSISTSHIFLSFSLLPLLSVGQVTKDQGRQRNPNSTSQSDLVCPTQPIVLI